jgi:hypothetical protein
MTFPISSHGLGTNEWIHGVLTHSTLTVRKIGNCDIGMRCSPTSRCSDLTEGLLVLTLWSYSVWTISMTLGVDPTWYDTPLLMTFGAMNATIEACFALFGTTP